MASSSSPQPDSDTEPATSSISESIPSTGPSSGSSLVAASTSSGPAVCLLRFAGDAAGGAFMGSIFGYGAPQALLQSCITFLAFSFIVEGLNKQQPGLAIPNHHVKRSQHEVPTNLALPLALPLPDQMMEHSPHSASPSGNPKESLLSIGKNHLLRITKT